MSANEKRPSAFRMNLGPGTIAENIRVENVHVHDPTGSFDAVAMETNDAKLTDFSAKNISVNTETARALRNALAELRRELETSEHVSEATTTLVDKADEELEKPQPDLKRLNGLFNGLAATIGTLNNAPGAWHTVKALFGSIFGF